MIKQIIISIAKEQGSEGLQNFAKKIILKLAKEIYYNNKVTVDQAKEQAKEIVKNWMEEVAYN